MKESNHVARGYVPQVWDHVCVEVCNACRMQQLSVLLGEKEEPQAKRWTEVLHAQRRPLSTGDQ